MRLRKGKLKDVDSIYRIKCRALKYYSPYGINWTEDYPSKETFKVDIQKEELYILEEEESNNIIGIVVINKSEVKEYDTMPWAVRDKFIVLHRVMTNPEYAGRGYGKYLIQKVSEQAKADGIKAIRLDTSKTNELGQKLYKSQGFMVLGEISQAGKNGSFYCLEKILE